MYRAVLDPGVLISARISSGGAGAPAELLRAWLEGDFDLIVSEKLLEELARVLQRQKFRRYTTTDETRQYVALLNRLAVLAADPALENVGLTPDRKDDYLVALARASEAHFLVSGDTHLTDLENPNPPVLSPKEFLQVIEVQSRRSH